MRREDGFTLVELIAVMIIAGILAVVATTALDTRGYHTVTFAEQVKAQLAYARKSAVAARREVQVNVAANQVSLTICPGTPVCGTAVDLPSPSGDAAFVSTVPSGVSLSPVGNFSFNAEGSTGGTVTLTISGDVTRNITVEGGTGYVH